jgi:hypothetical protein
VNDRQRELKKQYQAAERDRERGLVALTDTELAELLDFLDEQLGEIDCDHSLTMTRRWLATAGRGEEVLEGLRELGGHCDCEVLANVDGRF